MFDLNGNGAVDKLGLPFTGLVSFMRAPVCNDLTKLDADVAVLGAPTDEGSPWIPGARFAPRAIREQSVRARGGAGNNRPGYYDIDAGRRFLEREMSRGRIVDCGDVDVVYTNVPATFDNITKSVQGVLAAGAMPVVLGGDHAISFPVVRGIARPVDVIHFDAHLDFSPFQHGYWGTNGQPFRLMAELPHVGHMVQIGIRSLGTNESSLKDARDRGNDVASVKQTRQRGIESLLEHLTPGGPVYVSIDIDVLDMPLVPGCSSAELGGFDYHEFRDILAAVAERFEVVGFDLVEVNPMLDVRANHTSLTAARLMMEFIARIVEQPKWKAAHKVEAEAPGAVPG
jgi:agmatinase